jgi:hypothetical protein
MGLVSTLGAATPLDRPGVPSTRAPSTHTVTTHTVTTHAVMTHAASPAHGRDRLVSRPAVLWLVVGSAVAIGWTASDGGASARAAGDVGAELERLLRAMVVIKALLAAGAIGLIDWRFRSPASMVVALAYGAAASLIAAAPAVMWHLTHLVVGAVLFHVGVGLLLVIAWRDDGRSPLRPRR